MNKSTSTFEGRKEENVTPLPDQNAPVTSGDTDAGKQAVNEPEAGEAKQELAESTPTNPEPDGA